MLRKKNHWIRTLPMVHFKICIWGSKSFYWHISCLAKVLSFFIELVNYHHCALGSGFTSCNLAPRFGQQFSWAIECPGGWSDFVASFQILMNYAGQKFPLWWSLFCTFHFRTKGLFCIAARWWNLVWGLLQITHGPHFSCKHGRGIVLLLVLPELKLLVKVRFARFLGLMGHDFG